ncbi:glutamate 5-kinase [Notoacmeibacter sp. MSK16QG-6]|uniref:glutamate 5-kinase n=1 Tax=Notoacmeibacter sp. MSK16QG-6 TaxID=2957982 RepID=UPI0020A0F061|nr:glutamate 5-kinase [Notoacmeibacter sp. MSK16QG-6]MCP1200949.1 glutamate 5-kinase [Notoacmeibacter sp. MSK16QG-6]
MVERNTDFSQWRRIAIKVGSALLVDRQTGLRADWLAALCADIADLRQKGAEVLVVSSGAIALGRTLLGLPNGSLKLEENQAAAAMGQIALSSAWSNALATHDIRAGQILITLSDTEARRRYLNARATIGTLLKHGAVPVINENDTVATEEIRYGDNDRLAARVATMVGADLLVLLSDIDGLYTAPPANDPAAEFIATVPRITPQIEAMAGDAGSELSRGGMRTKIEAGKIATGAGCAMIIASGKTRSPISAIAGGARHTLFETTGTATARKGWIAGSIDCAGQLYIDEGAEKALRSGKSLLPAGIRHVEGTFRRGDPVSIHLCESGAQIARGLAGYDSDDAKLIAGHRNADIEAILNQPPRSAMVHRDDLVVI